MFVRAKRKGQYRYLQLVENHREGTQTVQRVLCTLGREEELKASGQIDVLARSLARFSQQEVMESTCEHAQTRVLTETGHPIPRLGLDRHPAHGAISGISGHGLMPHHEGVRPYTEKNVKASLTSADDSAAQILSKSPIFSGLDATQLVEFSRLAVERHLKRGEFLFSENDPVESLYVVASGMIKAVKHSFSGKDITLAVYGPGLTLANIILFVDEPHLCSGQAITDTRVLEIRRNEFLSFLHRQPKLSYEILLRMLGISGRRFHSVMIALSELVAERTDYRLARTLFTLNLEYGPVIPLTHREIAEMAGTATETATRFLSSLRQIGVVRSCRGKVLVLEQDKLRLIAQVPLLKCGPETLSALGRNS